MSFLEDLQDGKRNEDIVLKIVQELFPNDVWEKNEDQRGVDILSESGKTIECKYDRIALKTGNIYIEIECNGKPSGIHKYSRIDVLSYSFGDETLFINVDKLRDYINNNTLKKVKGGDGWRSVGILLPIEEARKLTSIIVHTYEGTTRRNET